MITLQVDLSYLSRYFNIDTKRLQTYRNKSITEIMEAEAANGNVQAQNYLSKVLKTPNELLKLFKLTNAKNRYKILKEMNQDDLIALLPYLEKKDLIHGLMFFTQDALMKCIKEMPKKEILKVLFESYSKENFLKMVPEQELNKFFESTKVDPKKVFEQLRGFNRDILAQMVENVTGMPQQDTGQKELLNTIQGMSPKMLIKAVQSLKPQHKCRLIKNLTQEDPDLWEEFSVRTLTKPLEKLDKADLIKNMSVLDEEMLVKVVDNLPKELLSVVLTQIDPEIFADVLASQFSNILKNVVSL